MPWQSRRLRGDRVWVKINPRGEPAAGADGRVDVRYRKGGKVYRAAARNLEVDPELATIADADAAAGEEGAAAAGAATPAPATPATKTRGKSAPGAAAAPAPADALIVYTDGACTGNPGPMGIGVVILDGKQRREVSEYLGDGTNNIAELTAVVRALELCPPERTVLLHTDSAYALGLLGKGWKPKANQELVARMRKVAKPFRDLRLVKVPGHAGVPENERCDALAREAVTRRR